MDRNIRTTDDVLTLLDSLFVPEAHRWTTDAALHWWDDFYGDRSKPVPFFVDKPDESLVSYVERGLITPARALYWACAGPGRNAHALASLGFTSTRSTSPRRRSPGPGAGLSLGGRSAVPLRGRLCPDVGRGGTGGPVRPDP
ncbi:hypothetical protein SMICM304S_07440 [Streptomyces microflavus]